jgi:hypothetical protein
MFISGATTPIAIVITTMHNSIIGLKHPVREIALLQINTMLVVVLIRVIATTTIIIFIMTLVATIKVSH